MVGLFEVMHEGSKEVPVQNAKIRLNKVTLQNYRNIEYKEYNLNGDSILLEGMNGLGKTNVLEAVYFAISGMLFNGTAKTESQEVIPTGSDKDVEVSVKLEFDYNLFVFERKVTQKWSKDGKTYKGLETKLLVNNAVNKNQGVAVNALLNYLGFSEIVAEFSIIPLLAKLNLFELIYNANSLRTLDYKIIRSIIVNMVGEVDFKEIIKADQDKYETLIEPLRSHGLDLAALKSNTRSKIFDKTNGLEMQVKNLKSTIKAYENDGNKIANKDELANAKKEVDAIDKEIGELNKQKTQSSDQTVKDINNNITLLENNVLKQKNALRVEYQQKISELSKNSKEEELSTKRKSLNDLKNDKSELNRKISGKEIKAEKYQSQLDNKEKEFEEAKEVLADLKKDWNKLKNPEPIGVEYSCPKCEHKFDVSDTKEYRELELDKINVKGKSQTQYVKGLKEGVGVLEDDVQLANDSLLKLYEERKQLNSNISLLEVAVNTLVGEVETYKSNLPILALDNDPKVIEYNNEIAKVEKEKSQLAVNRESYLGTISEKINALENKKAPHKQIISSETTSKSYLDNAKLKKKELKTVQTELQLQSEIVILIKDLEKDMYEKLDKKVSNVFGNNVKFKLYKLNVSNGEYDTRMCEIYVKDIDNRFVNIKTINTGMFPVRATEIITKIKAHYDMPKSFIFIDEMSSLDNNHLEMVKQFDEQILATRMVNKTTIQEVKF